MRKLIIPFMVLPFFLFGCGKNKNVYASSKNTIYDFVLDGENVIITGLNGNYKNQTDIIIPYSIDKHTVKRIENNSFDGVYRIKNVDMSKSKIEELGASSFKNCENLLKIDYPNTINKIENNCFEGCSKLVTMDLSRCNLTEIGDEMFSNCTSLTGVTFPSTTKIIGSNIFKDCESVGSLDFSYLEIEELKDYAFSNLPNLKDVILSNSTKIIGAYAFSNNEKIQFLNFAKTNIEEVGEGAFSNCKILANINLPQTLSKLGNKAFYHCSKLGKIDLSKTKIELIPESCFELCRLLDNIKLPEIEEISTKAFYNSSLRVVEIPKSVTKIADDAFRLCNKLESIIVDSENNDYIVQNNALYTADKGKLIVYPAACTETTFTISPDAKIINAYAFSDATNLVTVNLESIYLTEIAGYTFMNCTSLKNIYIIADATYGVKKIGVKAFFGCKSLVEFGKTEQGGDVSSLEEIGESAFYDCTALKSVSLRESTHLTKIDAEAFYNCNHIETLTLPGSLQVVSRAAFYNCTSVENFSFGANKTAFETLLVNNPDSGLEQFKDLL